MLLRAALISLIFSSFLSAQDLVCEPFRMQDLPKLKTQLQATGEELLFFASWCPYCTIELKKVAKPSSRIYVVFYDRKDKAENALRAHQITTGKCLFDEKNELSSKLKVKGVPKRFSAQDALLLLSPQTASAHLTH